MIGESLNEKSCVKLSKVDELKYWQKPSNFKEKTRDKMHFLYVLSIWNLGGSGKVKKWSY